MEHSAGIIAGSDPEQIVVTGYDPRAGRVSRKLYYSVEQFRAAHLKNGANPNVIEAAIVEARRNVLQ